MSASKGAIAEQAPTLYGIRIAHPSTHWAGLFQGTCRGLLGTQESAGINRIGVGNERVHQRRFSQSLWP